MDILQRIRTFSFEQREKDLILVYDGDDQLTSNPFTHQLFKTLKRFFNVRLLKAKDLVENNYIYTSSKLVLVISRLRNWHMFRGKSEVFFQKNKVFFYDQDPWEAYHDGGQCKGVYEHVFSRLEPNGFLVTSPWWADHIRSNSHIPVEFVRMGVLPEYCEAGPLFGDRPFPVGFQGTVHPHRMKFYDSIRSQGIDVCIFPKKPFKLFLDEVQKIRIFVYSDNSALTINGVKQPIHGLWGKCLTVAARGCFVIRNYDLAFDGYGIEDLPAVYTFQDEKEVPYLIKTIMDRSDSENQEMVDETVDSLRLRDDWQGITRALLRNNLYGENH